MQVFNTLSKNIQKFVPINDDNIVRIYSCGPTVYDHVHIGNLSSFIYADTLRRTLLVTGYEVQQTMNTTDVDDKTIKRSLAEDHSENPMTALMNLTGHYTDIFMKDMKSIGNDINKIHFVKATDHIEEMQNIITNLVLKDIAYVADDGVYFSIDAYKKSGQVYGKLLTISDDSTAGSRIENDEYSKESAHDFALWKKRKQDEPFWLYELNGNNIDGRPGWHIECSAMSQATIGLPFDIHTGGIDLIFPHHENEIAQSTADSDTPYMAKYFIHNEHLLVNGKKMTKSLKNYYTLNDINSKGIDPLAFRLLVLQSHYRSQINFTWESLISCQIILKDILAWADTRFQNLVSIELKKYYENNLPLLLKAFQNDMNTPEAFKILIDLIKKSGELGSDSEILINTLPLVESLFGINLLARQDINQTQSGLIKQRQTARELNDWQTSDNIREELKLQGIEVRDSGQGPIWQRL